MLLFPGGSRGEFTNCLRLNYGHPFDARIEEVLATLGRLLKASAG
jgi:DNA-binding transcriptional MocR family regulator